MKNNILKRMAERAKNRLLGRDNYPSQSSVCVKVIANEEVEFLERAKDVYLKSKENSTYNPIKMLMDENVLIKLDARGRERYLLETVDKYLKAKQSFGGVDWN